MIFPTLSAVIMPERGFFTEWMWPLISACTSEYSKERSAPSVVQFSRQKRSVCQKG